MILVEVEIKGVTPLLQHRFTENDEQDRATRNVLVQRRAPREEAEAHAHKNQRGFYFPGMAITALLREVASNHKLRGSRKSAKYVVPAAVFIADEAVYLSNGNGRLAKDFEVDSRPVVIPSTKGRIMRHRPRFDQWGATFTLRINDKVLPEEFIHQLLDEGGLSNGLGDYRPQKGGPYGTFQVVRWDIKK